MGELPDASDKTPDRDATTPSRSDALYIIASMADTTWRMFVPTIGLLLIGNWADGVVHTKPWLLLLGVAIGAGVSAYLIKRQLAKGKET